MERPFPFPRPPEDAEEEEAVEFFTGPGREACRDCSPSKKEGCARKPHTSGKHVAAGSNGLIYEVW